MIKYSTTTSTGIANRPSKEEVVSPIEYIHRKKLNTQDSIEQDTIKILKVIVESPIENRVQMEELVNSLLFQIVDTLGDSERMGLSIKIGEEIIKILVNSDDGLRVIKRAVMREYVSHIELPKVINGKKNPSTM